MNTSPTQKSQSPQNPQHTQASARPAGPWANGWVPVWEPATANPPGTGTASYRPARTTGRTDG